MFKSLKVTAFVISLFGILAGVLVVQSEFSDFDDPLASWGGALALLIFGIAAETAWGVWQIHNRFKEIESRLQRDEPQSDD